MKEENDCMERAQVKAAGPAPMGLRMGPTFIAIASLCFLAGSLSAIPAEGQEEEQVVEQEEEQVAEREATPVEAESPAAAPEEEAPTVQVDESSPVSALLEEEAATAVEEEDTTFYNELLVIVGAEGEAEYGEIFAENEGLWKAAADQGSVRFHVVGADDADALTAVETYLAESSKDLATPLWIVLIGHGTFDRRAAYFNLAGPDLSAKALQEWLEPFSRPVIILNTSSSSGAFLRVLSKENRIMVTATKSGKEVNFASFGSYLAKALLEPEADFNNDGENSVFELYQYAARQTADFYEQEGRIQTETPLIDDNGDGRGTSLEALAALREGGTSSRDPDGSFAKRWALVLSPMEQAIPAEMRQKRNVLESQIDGLRRRRHDLADEEYYSELEGLVVQIAELYAELEVESDESDGESSE